MPNEDGRDFEPCPRCGGELMTDGDGFEYCLACSYHETDQGSGHTFIDELEDARDMAEGFDMADDGDRDDDLSSVGLRVFGTAER